VTSFADRLASEQQSLAYTIYKAVRERVVPLRDLDAAEYEGVDDHVFDASPLLVPELARVASPRLPGISADVSADLLARRHRALSDAYGGLVAEANGAGSAPMRLVSLEVLLILQAAEIAPGLRRGSVVWLTDPADGTLAAQLKSLFPGVVIILSGAPAQLLTAGAALMASFRHAGFAFPDDAGLVAAVDAADFVLTTSAVVARSGLPHVDLVVDLGHWSQRGADRAQREIALAHGAGASFAYTRRLAGEATDLEEIFDSYFWPNELQLLDDKVRKDDPYSEALRPEFLGRHLLGWRRVLT